MSLDQLFPSKSFPKFTAGVIRRVSPIVIDDGIAVAAAEFREAINPL